MAQGSVHILFVHGVGQHSPLSSLLEAYQALRSDVRSSEVPHVFDDLLRNWKLEEFDRFGPPPYLRLRTKLPDDPGPLDAYIYEANYAGLAEVIRKNQPLDITYLFIGFDLAVNVARQRLDTDIAQGAPGLDVDARIAAKVQSLAEVFVAATVPILGLPSLIVRNYTRTWVAAFARFFDDVATFAMDGQSQQLVATHFNKTVRDIVASPRFTTGGSAQFIVAAHSLGTVVTHNFLLSAWEKGGPEVPAKLLTYGSPIGLVCWVWLFLDFPRLTFNAARTPTGNEYFVWHPVPAPTSPLRPIHWVNVVNHLDPIATAFPSEFVNLAMTTADISKALAGGQVHHHYIKTGGILSAGKAHTEYFADRERFTEIVMRLTGLAADDPATESERQQERRADFHWFEARADLFVLQIGCWAAGLGLLYLYFSLLESAFAVKLPYGVALPYVLPPVTIFILAFFQKLFFGRPTKRTPDDVLEAISAWEFTSLPYRLRQWLSPLTKALFGWLLFIAPGFLVKLGRVLMSFTPTLLFMLLPLATVMSMPDIARHLGRLASGHHWLTIAGLVILFAAYTMMFAISELARSWSGLLRILTSNRSWGGRTARK